MEGTSPTTPREEIAAMVRALRGERQQKTFAEACAAGVPERVGKGFNQGAISRWERADDMPTPVQLRRMFDVAGGSVDDLNRGLSLILGFRVAVPDDDAPRQAV